MYQSSKHFCVGLTLYNVCDDCYIFIESHFPRIWPRLLVMRLKQTIYVTCLYYLKSPIIPINISKI